MHHGCNERTLALNGKEAGEALSGCFRVNFDRAE
jgi:hypothetical protein